MVSRPILGLVGPTVARLAAEENVRTRIALGRGWSLAVRRAAQSPVFDGTKLPLSLPEFRPV